MHPKFMHGAVMKPVSRQSLTLTRIDRKRELADTRP